MRYQEISFRSLGTNININILHNEASTILHHCKEIIQSYHERFTIFDDKSELMAINLSAGIQTVKVKKDLFELIKIGKLASQDNSNLNICIGPLVKLWNIGFDSASVPSQKDIEESLELCNPEHIRINHEDGSIFLEKKGMQIDLGAIAKGYIADKVLEYLISNDVHSAFINLGGNIICHGFNLQSADLYWHVGLQDPYQDRGHHLLKLAINDLSIVSSGTYERHFMENGKDYHHILDPKTGYPIDTNMLSLTIISDKSIDGEIWTSKLFGMDFNQIESLLPDRMAAVSVYKDRKIKCSKYAEKYILN